MPNNECIAFFDPGDDLNGVVQGANVTGKRFVKVVGPKKDGSLALAANTDGGRVPVGPATGAGDRIFAVAAYDAVVGAGLPLMRGNKVVPVEAGAAMTAGDVVMADSVGRAVTRTGTLFDCGTVLNSPTAAGQTAIVALNL